MKAVVFSFTQAGTALGCRVAAHLRGEGWDVRQASLKKFAVVQEEVLPFTPNLHDEAARAFEAARRLHRRGGHRRPDHCPFYPP